MHFWQDVLLLKLLQSCPQAVLRWTGREFTSPQGIPILVGRNSRENELLTLQIAKDPDVRMHRLTAPALAFAVSIFGYCCSVSNHAW